MNNLLHIASVLCGVFSVSVSDLPPAILHTCNILLVDASEEGISVVG